MRYIAATILTCSMLLSIAASASTAEKSVVLTGSIEPAGKANQFTVTVQMDIRKGWHAYDEPGEGPETRTSLELKLPVGVTSIGDWNRPSGVDGSSLNSLVYEGRVSFSKSVAVEANALGKSIDAIVRYQICTNEKCNPPTKKTISIAIPKAEPTSSSIFEPPVRLTVKDMPLNGLAKKRYPSPAVFDVDGDGKAELVIGDLMGNIGVYENLNTSETGDPVWDSRKELRGVSGDPVQTPNW